MRGDIEGREDSPSSQAQLTGCLHWAGLAGRPRAAALNCRAVTDLHSLDVYSFGLVMYELQCGRELETATLDTCPPGVPDMVGKYCCFSAIRRDI